MPRVVFIEQFYYPDGWAGAQLPRDVTIALARHGFEVQVICGRDQYAPATEDAGDDPREEGVSIRYIPRILRGDLKRWKLLRQLWFYAAALPLLLLRRSPAAFVAQTNPPLVVPLVALAAWVHRRPFVVIAQDLYPEVVFAHGMLHPRSIVGRTLSALFRWAYAGAARVVSLGPTMTTRLTRKGVASERIVCISNWATGAPEIVTGPDNRLRREWGLGGCFVLLYSGNLGLSHDVETPILAMRELLGETADVRLVFVGAGSRLEEARRLARSAEVEDAVSFRPWVPSSLLPHSLGLADLALVTLRRGFEGLVVPSKALGYMARGVPMLYVGPPSDIQQLIQTAGSGRCVDGGDQRGFAAAVKRAIAEPDAVREMGDAGRRYYDRELDRAIALKSYCRLLEDVTAKPGAL